MGQQIYPLLTREDRIALATEGQGFQVKGVTGTTGASSPTLTAMGPLGGVAIGATVVGVGIPASPAPTVLALDDAAHTVEMSASTTSAHVGNVITFTNPASTILPGLQGAQMRLYLSSYGPNINTDYAALSAAQPVFAGYAAIVGVFTLGFIPPTNIPQSISQLLSWSPTDALAPVTIGGVWATDGTNVIGVWPLDQVVALNSPANELAVVCCDAFPAPGFLTQVRP